VTPCSNPEDESSGESAGAPAAVLADRVFTAPIGRAFTRLNLATGYRASARYDDADRELRKGMAIVENELGNHPALTNFMLVEMEIAAAKAGSTMPMPQVSAGSRSPSAGIPTMFR
jgi:hypothetical protein